MAARYRGEAPSPLGGPNAPTFPKSNFCITMAELAWNVQILFVSIDPFDNIVLRTTNIELQDMFCRALVAAFSSMVDVIKLFQGYVAAIDLGDVHTTETLRHITEKSEVQLKYDFLVTLLSSVNTVCDI